MACEKASAPAPDPSSANPICYAEAERARPGRFIFRRPKPCDLAGHHFKVWGGPRRPERIDEIDAKGRMPQSTRIRYAKAGHPELEKQLVYKISKMSDLPELSTRTVMEPGTPAGPVSMLRYLDPGSRVTRMDKIRGDLLLERVERSYRGGRLVEERGMDGQGVLRYTMRLVREAGKLFREVYGPDGVLQSRTELVGVLED